MNRTFSRTEIVVGTSVSLVLLIGFSATAWYCITHEIREPQPHARFAAIWFSLMMALMGLSGLLRFASLRVRGLSTMASLTWCAGFSMFGLSFILIGVFENGSLSGGIPLLPKTVNQAFGSTVFILAGLVVLAIIPKLFRHQQKHGGRSIQDGGH